MQSAPNRAQFHDHMLFRPMAQAEPMRNVSRETHKQSQPDPDWRDSARIDLSPLLHQMSDDLLAMAESANPDAFAGPAPDLNPFPALFRLLGRAAARLLTWPAASTDTLPNRHWEVTGAHRHARDRQPG